MIKSKNDFNGILLIDKPYKETSFHQIAKLRHKLGIKKIGHCGTLDPLATGLLILCINKATKISEYLLGQDKEYVGEIKFGYSTTTDDREGEILKKSSKRISTKELLEILDEFKGDIKQIPPKFSAIKINGKKAYELARKKIDVNLNSRNVVIHELNLISFNEMEQLAKIHIKCSKGTYIRSLSRDIGEMVGSYAHLYSLIRTKSGNFSLNSKNYKVVKNIDSVKKEDILDNIISISQSLIDFNFLKLKEESEIKVKYGKKLLKSDFDFLGNDISVNERFLDKKLYKVYNRHDNTVAIIDNNLNYIKVLV